MKSPVLIHGRHAYIKHGCRCGVCVKEHRDYQREYSRQRTIEARNGGRPWNRAVVNAVDELPILDGMPAGPWVAKAVCRGRSEWEMSENAMRSRNTRKHANTGIAIAGCNVCPSLAECRTWVMSYRLDPCAFHVVAGMTPRQRNEERERAGIATPGRRYRGNAA